jgi:hypothetical protein
MMRLPMAVIVAGVALELCWGADAEATPLGLPRIDNPYCNVPTYLISNIPEQAVSLIDSDGQPVIVISATVAAQRPIYTNFLMAHECCHHILGHVRKFHQELGHIGPQPFFYMKPALRGMELDADCCAARILKRKGEENSIEAGEKVMLSFGDQATGAYYPTGTERAKHIAVCAASDLSKPMPVESSVTQLPPQGENLPAQSQTSASPSQTPTPPPGAATETSQLPAATPAAPASPPAQH